MKKRIGCVIAGLVGIASCGIGGYIQEGRQLPWEECAGGIPIKAQVVNDIATLSGEENRIDIDVPFTLGEGYYFNNKEESSYLKGQVSQMQPDTWANPDIYIPGLEMRWSGLTVQGESISHSMLVKKIKPKQIQICKDTEERFYWRTNKER
jgi:hypothetical protein